MKYKKYSLENFNVYTVKTDRFKNCHMEIIFNEDIKKSTVTKRCFLNRILTHTSNEYKTELAKNIRLEELYDSGFGYSTSKIGNTMRSTFIFDFLNPKYCKKGTLSGMLDFVFGCLNKPNIVNDGFDKTSFEAVRNTIESSIRSQKEDPQDVAFDKIIGLMSKGNPLNYLMPGTLRDLKKITPENLYSYYKEAFKEVNCDILIAGDLDMEEIIAEINKRFIFKGNKNYKIKFYSPLKELPKEQVIIKKAKYNQSILVMGYNANGITREERQITSVVINEILDGGLDGKLSKYLRKDNSLCYSVFTDPKPSNDVLFISAAISKNGYSKSVKLIKKAINDIKKGDITKEELNNAKKSLINFLDTIDDRQKRLVNDYYMTSLGFFPTIKERKEGIKKTTIKDIKKVAAKLKINTTFFLEGNIENEED